MPTSSCSRTSIITDSIGSSEGRRQRHVDGVEGSADEGWPHCASSGRRLRARRRPARSSSRAAASGQARPQPATCPIGYYRDPEKTAQTFVTGADGRRYVIPGDFAMLEADGTITLLGRGSVSINSGGEKIFPEEVENAVRSHPAVFDAVVVGVPDERWGETVTAVVLARDGATIDLEELQVHARQHIAGYKVPRRLVLVDQMERSPSGKPDYRWAKQQALDTLDPRRMSGPLTGLRVVELVGLGPRSVLRDAARRPRVRRRRRRAARRRCRGTDRTSRRRARSCGASAASRSTSRNLSDVESLLELLAAGRRLHRSVPAGRLRTARDRTRRRDGPQPPDDLRADDRLGPDRVRGPTRPATTSTTSRSPVRCT